MISYKKVSRVLQNPPPKDLVDLYNEIDARISNHTYCVTEDEPLKYLDEVNVKGELVGKFCVSATSIQSKYVAFVLGKNAKTTFPNDIIQMFFNIENCYKMQFGRIKGKKIDGCICLIHQEDENFDLQRVYDSIYDL
ncbi:MAG TPA: hypothetical protein ENJ53_05845 [Phaeodactylibacter sp.]|nr:hypothetical protein [Phaeodactylibacter sp.]